MWRLVLILTQFVVYVISEDVTYLTNEIDRTTDIEAIIPLLRVPLRQYGRFESRDSAEQSEHHQNRRSLSGFGIFMQIGKFLQDIVEPETSMKKPNEIVDIMDESWGFPKIPDKNSLPTENLRNWKDLYYTGPIYIGSPKPQKFMVVFDTASSDILVPSVICHDKVTCKMSRRYNASRSETYEKVGEPLHIGYLKGSAKGFISKDIIMIAGLPIEHQPFAEITEIPEDAFSKSDIDGIFGLGFKDISGSSPDETPLDRLKTQGLIRERVFCLHLNDQKPKIGGELIIGGCDVEAEFYVPVSYPGRWQFYVSLIQFTQKIEKHNKEHNKGSLHPQQILFTACKNGCHALLDSGSSYICGPRNEIIMINRHFGASFDKRTQQYVLRCGKKGLPNVVINLNGYEITLEPKDYLIRIGFGFCLSGFQEVGEAEGSFPFEYIIGVNALRRFVSIFDIEKKRIGFKPLRK